MRLAKATPGHLRRRSTPGLRPESYHGPGAQRHAIFAPKTPEQTEIQRRFLCRCCGERHAGPPFAYGVDAPVYWRDEFASDPNSMLSDEQCIIQAEYFFVRARIAIPVLDVGTEFEWGVWVSLSRANFQRAHDLWTTDDRESEPPYFGWLSTALPYEPSPRRRFDSGQALSLSVSRFVISIDFSRCRARNSSCSVLYVS